MVYTPPLSKRLPPYIPEMIPGFRLPDGTDFQALVNLNHSLQTGVTATPAGTVLSAFQLTAAINVIATAASGSAVRLPTASAGNRILIKNAGANAVRIFAPSFATINGIAGDTGILQEPGSFVWYICDAPGDGSGNVAWEQITPSGYDGDDILVTAEDSETTRALKVWMRLLLDVAAPQWITQPVGGLADATTGVITLTAEAIGDFLYQWQSWDGTDWTDVSGETGTSLDVTPTGAEVYALYATGQGLSGSSRSNAACVAPWPRLLTGYRIAATDSFDLGITGAYSMSRDIVDGFSGSRYTDAGGGSISAIIDQSAGTAGSLAQATAGRRPVAATNNRLLADFDGTDDVLVAAGLSPAIFGTTEAYAVLTLIIDSKDWNSGDDPYDNDLIFGDSGGVIALGYKSGPGGGSFSMLDTRYVASTVNGTPLVVTDANCFQQIASYEYKADGATFEMRAGGATGVTAWSSTASVGDFDWGNNTLSIAGLDGGDGAQIRLYETVFTNALMSDTQADALRAAMRAWAAGEDGTPWAASLPSYGQPWNALTELDTAFDFCGIADCEAQYGEGPQAFARAFILSAPNPDWLQVARFELRAGDDWNTTERTEIETTQRVLNGETITLSSKFLIDATTQDDHCLIMQFHASSTPPEGVDGTSAALGLRYSWNTPGSLLINSQLSLSNPASPGQVSHEYWDEPVAKGVWHDLVIQWTPDPTGAVSRLKVWLDTVLIVNSTTASGFSAANDGYYLKFGAYNGFGDEVDPFIIYHCGLEVGEDALARVDFPLRNPSPDATPDAAVSGTYLPVCTIVANLDSVTPNAETSWYRVGDMVTVFGTFSADPTAAASTVTTFRMSLPVASNFANANQAGGTAGNLLEEAVRIISTAATDDITISWLSKSTVAGTRSFQFSYQVIP